MRNALVASLSVLGLAACEMPASDALVVSSGAHGLGAEVIAPRVSVQRAINTFAQFCGRFPGNPSATERAVRSAGYRLFVSGSGQGLAMFASPDGGPMVATGREDGSEVCMVLLAEGRDLGPALEAFVNQRHGSQVIEIGALQTPSGVAQNVWASLEEPPVMYFTMEQSQPLIGDVEAIALVTE